MNAAFWRVWKDGPEAIVTVRNDLVHSRSRMTVQARQQTWQLANPAATGR
jgi:hypothetical protein